MTTGGRIKEVRNKLGISQVDFADKINVSKQTLYKYENNIITNIPSDKIEAAAQLANVSPAYLMGWTNEQVPPATVISSQFSKQEEQKEELVTVYEQLTSTNQDKVITYSKNLLVTQQMEEEAITQAAHERTDIEVTDEMKRHDDDIMDDDDF